MGEASSAIRIAAPAAMNVMWIVCQRDSPIGIGLKQAIVSGILSPPEPPH